MRRLLRKIEGLGGIPGPEAHQMKKLNTPNVDACAVEINSTSKSEVFPTWAPLPNPKEMKASLSKSTSFQIHSSKCSFKTAFVPNFNLQILSSKSNLRSSFTNLFNFKFSKTCWKSPKLYKRSLTHFQKMSLARWFWAFFFKVFCLVKWAKTNAFSSIGKMKADKTAKSFPTYRILNFEVW